MTGICTLLSGAFFQPLELAGYYLMAGLAAIGLAVTAYLYMQQRKAGPI